MTTFVVYAGPNGSGKSSVRDSKPIPVEVVIDPDRIAREINPQAPRSVDNEAGKRALRLFDETIKAGRSVSMETTLTGYSVIRRMEQAKAAGYQVGLVYVALDDPELNVVRVAERARRGGHAIDPDTVLRRVGRSLENLPRALAIADQAIVFDNSGLSHRRVLEAADGRITFLAQDLPGWLDEQMPQIAGLLQARREQAAAPPSAASAAPPPARPKSLTSLLNALSPPEPETRQPWEPAPAPMADRVRAFEIKAAETKAAEAKARSPQEPEQDPEPPKPRSGPKPG